MFSKALSVLLLFFGSALISSCSLPLYEKPPADIAPDTGLGDSTACLSTLPKVIEKFAAATARDAEISAMFDCMSTAISTFERSTQGRFEDRFTSKELTNFIRQYFLTEGTEISDSLRTEAFRVKQLFVGGANDSITRKEMGDLVAVIGSLKTIAVGLNPYAKVYFQLWKVSNTEPLKDQMAYFQKANEQIQVASRGLGGLIEKTGQSYKIDNAVVLAKELAALNSSKWPWISELEKAMPLVRKLKRTLTGGSETTVEPKEWTRFALLSGRGYIQYLRYIYFLENAPPDLDETQLYFITETADDVFLFMGDMVEGKPNKILTRQELLEILQALSHFVPKLKISDSLLLEMMKVKVLLFGGGVDRFTKADFDKARAKLELYQSVASKFLDYADVYALSWDPSSRPDALKYFAQSEANLKAVASRFGESFETSYDLQDLVRLAKEFDQVYPDRNGRNYQATAQKYIPILISLKNILLSDSGSIIGDQSRLRTEWGRFLTASASLYSKYAFYTYFIKPLPPGETADTAVFSTFVSDCLTFVESVIVQKPATPISQISLPELHQLFASLQKAELLPQRLTLANLDTLAKVLVSRILTKPQDRLAGNPSTGFSVTSSQILRSEFEKWKETGNFLNRIYSGAPALSGAQLLAQLGSATGSEPLKELKMVLETRMALSSDSLGRIQFTLPAADYLKTTTEQMNLVREAVRLILRSYANDISRIDSYQGLTSEEFVLFFNDIRPILLDLELLDPTSKSFAQNRFRDADLFSTFGNGNDLASFQEISSLGMLLLSGFKIDKILQDPLAGICPIAHPTSEKHTWSADYSCLLNYYSGKFDQAFASMPEFIRFKATLTPEQFGAMYLNLLKSAGYVPDASNQVRLSDLSLFPHVTQYVETFFQIYDSNHDGILDTTESMRAYPTFKNTLHTVSKLNGDVLLKGLFAWLLKNGKAPEVSEQLKFLAWSAAGEKTWDIKADRAKLAQILGVIADAMAKQTQN